MEKEIEEESTLFEEREYELRQYQVVLFAQEQFDRPRVSPHYRLRWTGWIEW